MPLRRKQIESFVGLRQARAFPRSRRLAGEFRDGVDRPFDRIGLIVELVHRALNESVAHELKAGIERGGSDAGIGTADVGIQRQRHRHLAVGQRLELPPEAGAHSVFVPRPVRHVRQQRLSHRRAQHGSRHRVLDPPFLDIEDDPYRKLLAARQPEFRPVDLRLIGNAIGKSHGEPFLGWLADYSAALDCFEVPALTRGMTFSAIRIIDWRPSSRSFQSLPAYSSVPNLPTSSWKAST